MIPKEERSRLPVAFLVGIVIVAVLVSAAVLYSKYAAPAISEDDRPLVVGPVEQAYAPQIHFLEPKMSRAANFLNQEVTYLAGGVLNSGDRTLTGIEATIEFQDYMKQIALRETRPILFGVTAALPPGKTAHFEISFDHIPSSWNMQLPTVQVAGLQFARTDR